MSIETGSLTEQVISMLDDGQGREYIESFLVGKGHDEKFIKELVREAAKLRHSKRLTQGLTLMLVGALVCFTSFLFTITGTFSHDSFGWILYGLTTGGILIVFMGLMKIF